MDTQSINEKIYLCEHRDIVEDFAICKITNNPCFAIPDTLNDVFCLFHRAFEKGKKVGYEKGFDEGAESEMDCHPRPKDW